MTLLDSLPSDDLAVVEGYLQAVRFSEGARIIDQGEPGDGCYFIDEGKVRLQLDVAGEPDSEAVLGFLEPSGLLGEFSLIDQQTRSASAYAHTDVAARFLSASGFQTLCERHPRIGVAMLTAFGRDLTRKIRVMNERVQNYITTDAVPAMVDEMVARAGAAQKAFEPWAEDRVNALLRDVADAVTDQAESLAADTVEETRMGVVADKAAKIRFASLDVCEMLLSRPGAGVLAVDEQRGITEIAGAAGVVLGLVPLTNPVPTLIFKTLICLKSRNALILSSHPGAMGVGNRAGEIVHTVLRDHGAPVDIIQWIRELTSRQMTSMFMMHDDVSIILATGGPSMVKAAYSSGTPAIAVGPGNAPAWVCADADAGAVAEMVVGSKSFDNGVICGSGNNLVVDACIREAFVETLVSHGAAVLSAPEVETFTAAVIVEGGHLLRELIGQSAEKILEAAGIGRDYPVRLVVVPVGRDAIDGPFGMEMLAPVVPLFTVAGRDDGMALCQELLARFGAGHTAIIHTGDDDLVRQFALKLPVSRILVNCPGSQGCIGMGNGLTPSLTLGCGTYGGGSTTDNVTYNHLINVKRIAQAL